jgi:hypothetical protein
MHLKYFRPDKTSQEQNKREVPELSPALFHPAYLAVVPHQLDLEGP